MKDWSNELHGWPYPAGRPDPGRCDLERGKPDPAAVRFFDNSSPSVGATMPKGQQKQGSQNKPKLSVKEKAEKKAAKKAKAEAPVMPLSPKR